MSGGIDWTPRRPPPPEPKPRAGRFDFVRCPVFAPQFTIQLGARGGFCCRKVNHRDAHKNMQGDFWDQGDTETRRTKFPKRTQSLDGYPYAGGEYNG